MGSECSTDKCSKRKNRPKPPVLTQAPAPVPTNPIAGEKPRSWQREKSAYEAQQRLHAVEIPKDKTVFNGKPSMESQAKVQERPELAVIDEGEAEDLATFRVSDAVELPENCHESSDEDPPPMPNQPRDAQLPSQPAHPRANLLPKFNEVAK